MHRGAASDTVGVSVSSGHCKSWVCEWCFSLGFSGSVSPGNLGCAPSEHFVNYISIIIFIFSPSFPYIQSMKMLLILLPVSIWIHLVRLQLYSKCPLKCQGKADSVSLPDSCPILPHSPVPPPPFPSLAIPTCPLHPSFFPTQHLKELLKSVKLIISPNFLFWKKKKN